MFLIFVIVPCELRNQVFFGWNKIIYLFFPAGKSSSCFFFSGGGGPLKQIQGADGMFFGFHMMLGFNKVRGCRCPKIGLEVAEWYYRGLVFFLILCAFCVHRHHDYHCLKYNELCSSWSIVSFICLLLCIMCLASYLYLRLSSKSWSPPVPSPTSSYLSPQAPPPPLPPPPPDWKLLVVATGSM